jgi:hypothetical protein
VASLLLGLFVRIVAVLVRLREAVVELLPAALLVALHMRSCPGCQPIVQHLAACPACRSDIITRRLDRPCTGLQVAIRQADLIGHRPMPMKLMTLKAHSQPL